MCFWEASDHNYFGYRREEEWEDESSDSSPPEMLLRSLPVCCRCARGPKHILPTIHSLRFCTRCTLDVSTLPLCSLLEDPMFSSLFCDLSGFLFPYTLQHRCTGCQNHRADHRFSYSPPTKQRVQHCLCSVYVWCQTHMVVEWLQANQEIHMFRIQGSFFLSIRVLIIKPELLPELDWDQCHWWCHWGCHQCGF